MDYRTIQAELEIEYQKNREFFEKRSRDREAYYAQVRELVLWKDKCLTLMFYYKDRLPFEVWKEFMMDESFGAYLPIEVGTLIKNEFCNPLDGYKLHMKNKVLFL